MADRPDPTDPGTGLPPPSAAELLAAVHDLLADEVLGATEGATRHRVRVAAHVVAQLEREARLGPGLAGRHARRLAMLGAESDGDLAAAIRDGRLDGRVDVGPTLLEDAADRLQVVHPAWAVTPPPPPGAPDPPP